MDFVAVLDQVVDLLRQRGRVTYRTLKRQFQLDDEALADLTVELIKGQRLAVDEDSEVLHQHSALYPMIDLLERVVLRFERQESAPQKLRKLEGFLV